MVYIIPTEASNGPMYMDIARLMLTITDLTYICDKFGLTAERLNTMSRFAEFNQTRWQIFKPKTKGLAFFKLHNKDY